MCFSFNISSFIYLVTVKQVHCEMLTLLHTGHQYVDSSLEHWKKKKRNTASVTVSLMLLDMSITTMSVLSNAFNLQLGAGEVLYCIEMQNNQLDVWDNLLIIQILYCIQIQGALNHHYHQQRQQETHYKIKKIYKTVHCAKWNFTGKLSCSNSQEIVNIWNHILHKQTN